jgi:hypothetical protein
MYLLNCLTPTEGPNTGEYWGEGGEQQKFEQKKLIVL